MSEETKAPVFDSERPIKMRLQSPDGLKVLSLRFPSDDEWITRENGKRLITRKLPDGSEETSLDSEEADAELVAKILTEAADVDPAEATIIVQRLNQAEPDE